MALELVTPLPPGASSRTRLAKHGARLLVLREILDGTDCSWPDAAPGLVTLQEVGELQGKRHALFEWVPGVTLRDVVSELEATGNPVPLGLVGRVVLDAARALAAVTPPRAHGGLADASLHLGFDGRVWVLDWGAPRLGRFRPLGRVNYAADVFALGGVVHSALTGFRGEYASAPATLPTPSTSHSEATPALDDVVMRALSTQPDARQHDVGAFADELEVVLGEQLFTELQVSDVVTSLFKDRIKLLRSLGGLAEPGRADSLEAILPIPTGTQPFAPPVALPPEPKPMVPWDSAELAPLPPSEPTLPRVVSADLRAGDDVGRSSVARPIVRTGEGTALTADGLASVAETALTAQSLAPIDAEKTGVVVLPPALGEAAPTTPRLRSTEQPHLALAEADTNPRARARDEEDTDPRARVTSPTSESSEDATAVGAPGEAGAARARDAGEAAARGASDARPGNGSPSAASPASTGSGLRPASRASDPGASEGQRASRSAVAAGEGDGLRPGASEGQRASRGALAVGEGDGLRSGASEGQRASKGALAVGEGDGLRSGASEGQRASKGALAVGEGDGLRSGQRASSRAASDAGGGDGLRAAGSATRAAFDPSGSDDASPAAEPPRAQAVRSQSRAAVTARDTAPDDDELVPRPSPRGALTTRARPHNASSPSLEETATATRPRDDDTAPRPKPPFVDDTSPRPRNTTEHERHRALGQERVPTPPAGLAAVSILGEDPADLDEPTAVREKPKPRPRAPAPLDTAQSLAPIHDEDADAAPLSHEELPSLTAQTPAGGGALRVVMVGLAVLVVGIAAAVVVKAQRAASVPPPELAFEDAGDEALVADAGVVAPAVVEVAVEDAGALDEDAGAEVADAGEAVAGEVDAGAPEAVDAGAPDAGEKPAQKPVKKPAKKPVKKKKKR